MQTYYTPKEVAQMLKLSTNKVTETFAGQPGVITLAKPKPGRRGYRTLRISAEAIERLAQKA